MVEPASDAVLVARARLGDEPAFAILVERHWARLVALARSVVGDADAEDLVQDCLVSAWGKLGQLREPASFRPWLMRSVVRASVRRARRRAWLVPLEGVAEPSDQRAADEVALLEVVRFLAALAPRQRAVMHLTVIEGMSDSEIGSTMGIDAASVRSHRRRARERLQALWAPAAAAAWR